MTVNAQLEQLSTLLVKHRRNTAAVRRLQVIAFTLRGGLTAAQIAAHLGIARSTVFAYRTMYAEKGIEKLLARLRAGRPGKKPSPALTQVIVRGLRLLSWFNVPALVEWIRHHDREYPHWTVRRWALALIKRFKIRFKKDWREEREKSLEAWRRAVPLAPHNNASLRPQSNDSVELSLRLEIEESPGLRPWLELAA